MGVLDDIMGKKPGKKVNGKAKGSKNERSVAKWLTEWTGEEFNRTPMSGGLRWLDASRIAGDVVAPVDSKFPFCIEAKSYKMIEVKSKLRSNSIIFTFWRQCLRDAERVGKHPMLFIRKNGMAKDTHYIFVDRKMGEVIEPLCSSRALAYGQNEQYDIMGFHSDSLLNSVDYGNLLTSINDKNW